MGDSKCSPHTISAGRGETYSDFQFRLRPSGVELSANERGQSPDGEQVHNRIKDNLLEQLGRDEAGARKRRKHPAGPQNIHRHPVYVLVAARRPYRHGRQSKRGQPYRIRAVKFSTPPNPIKPATTSPHPFEK